MRVAELLLRGAGGEPVDFARTIVSHGVAELPPNRVELAARTLETTLPVPRGARTVSITASARRLHVEAVAGTVGAQAREALTKTVAHMFRLDEDLSRFYTLVSEEGDLSWCAAGAGRMLRAPTVFEDVVKTNRTLIRKPERVRIAAPVRGDGLIGVAGAGIQQVKGKLSGAGETKKITFRSAMSCHL